MTSRPWSLVRGWRAGFITSVPTVGWRGNLAKTGYNSCRFEVCFRGWIGFFHSSPRSIELFSPRGHLAVVFGESMELLLVRSSQKLELKDRAHPKHSWRIVCRSYHFPRGKHAPITATDCGR